MRHPAARPAAIRAAAAWLLLRLTPSSGRAWARTSGLGLVAAILLAAWITGRPATATRVERVVIPAPVTTRHTRLMCRGWQVILEPGLPGAYDALVRETRVAGRVIRREEVETRLIAPPRAQVILAGTNAEDNSIHAPRVTRVVTLHRVLATAYDPGPEDNGWDNAGSTRLGWRTRHGIVAVDPRVIPLRSLLYVEGYGLAWAGDTGGAIKGKRLDLCFNRTEDALAWGRRQTTAYVLEGVGHGE
jgi:3D (Asp-Asp-Asp) domain-containing protein